MRSLIFLQLGERKKIIEKDRLISLASFLHNGFNKRTALNNETHLFKLSLHHKLLVGRVCHGNKCKSLIK